MRQAALAAAVAALVGGCNPAGDQSQAEGTVAGFLTAVDNGDGARACAALSRATARKLEREEEAPCAEAVTELELSASDPVGAELYVTSAQVRLDDGESAFLDQTPEGWRVSAAGCRPEPGEEQPHACEIED